jgi:membrane protease YdiL (CAAX protease family)
MRRLHDELFVPLFSRIGPREVVFVSLAAGVGEEVLFRGAIQAEAGWLAASVLFGMAHVGGAGMIALGAWAAVIGGLLGWLRIATGGLLAPVVAHVCYDAMALAYIRGRGRRVKR